MQGQKQKYRRWMSATQTVPSVRSSDAEITRKYPDDDCWKKIPIIVQCKGAGGQSFGAFIPKGLTLELVGDSNDYFGKGLIRR